MRACVWAGWGCACTRAREGWTRGATLQKVREGKAGGPAVNLANFALARGIEQVVWGEQAGRNRRVGYTTGLRTLLTHPGTLV